MKKVILLLVFVLSSFVSNMEAFQTIDAGALKKMIDSEAPFILLDARGDRWNDKNIIPGAKLAGSDFSEERLRALIPSPESLIVVYGFSATCPKAHMLAEKLMSLGYENVIEYPDGLKVWRDVSGYPVDEIK